ncbi:MAG: entericidin A/B family lipoprotein [Parvibaculaceae bacterium]|nr:entericidin A/B family lipoprotein [Parvibaculaceae bacterium]
MSMLRSIRMLGLTMAMALGIAACNTVEGVGQDIENTGDAIQDSAREASD